MEVAGLLKLHVVVLVVAQLIFSVNAESTIEQVDPQKCLVWGPGLKSEIVAPARYFMIQLVDKNGNKYAYLYFYIYFPNYLIK